MLTINLIPPEYLKREQRKLILRVAGIAGSSLGAIVLLSSALLVMRSHALTKQKKNLEAEVSKLEEIAREVDALEAKKTSIESKSRIVERLLQGRFDYPKLMEALAECLPPNQVAIRSLEIQRQSETFKLRISAEATHVNSIIQWLVRLEERQSFSNVILGPITYSATLLNFQIEMEYKLP